MIGLIVSLLVRAGLESGTAEKFAKPVMFAALALLAIPVLFGLKSCYDSSVIDNAVNEANSEFVEEKDKATGKADVASEQAKVEHEAKIKKTEELIDEAIKEGCAVAEYLASSGNNCVQ